MRKSQLVFKVPDIREITRTHTVPDTYKITLNPTIQPMTGLQCWLVKWAWRVMRKYHHVDEVGLIERYMSYDTVEVRAEELIKAIFKTEADIRRYYNKDIEMIIVGRNDYAGIAELARQYMSFGMPPHEPMEWLSDRGIKRVINLHGIPVRCIPWAEGIILIPKEDKG